jgi:hypothetical protein
MTTPTTSTVDPFAGPYRATPANLAPGFFVTDGQAPAKWKGHELWTTKLRLSFGRETVDVDAPYTPAGRVHDMRRSKWVLDLTVKWLGDGWWERLFNFVTQIDSQGTADWLDLPGRRGSVYVKAGKGAIDWETIREGCELTFQFREDTNQERVDLLQQLHASPLTQASAMVPDDAPEVQTAVDDYATAVRDPNATEADRQAAMNDVYTAIGDERGNSDTDTAEGCQRDDDLEIVQHNCQDAYPGDVPANPYEMTFDE